MAGTGVVSWSQTSLTNGSSDSAINWNEGQAPSSVNDSARAMMASVAKYRDDNNGSLTTGGTSTAYTLTTNQVFASLTAMDKQELTITMSATSGATPTLAVDGLTAKPIRMATGATLPTGALLSGSTYELTYYNTAGEFLIKNQVSVATNSLLGNVSGSTAAPTPVTIGTGLVVSGATLTAPAFTPPGVHKNLVITSAGGVVTFTVAADFVTMTDGTSYLTHSLSGTIDLGTNGAANTLDTGTIAQTTWYAVWAIAKADGTTAGLASLSATAPTMPSGYTFKARIGWVRTVTGSAVLATTLQKGKRAQWGTVLQVTSGATGNVTTGSYTAVSVSNIVPSTASVINGYVTMLVSIATALLAPNGSYGSASSTTAAPPVLILTASSNNATVSYSFMLESTNIYYASTSASCYVYALGWEDNL